MSTWPDNATLYREREEANEASEQFVSASARFAEMDPRTDEERALERVIRDLYWTLWGAVREEIALHVREDPDHEGSLCWKCLAIKRMGAVEKRFRDLRGLEVLEIDPSEYVRI